MKIRKKKIPEINGKIWDFFNANRDKRFIVNKGGAGSGKSHTTAQWFVIKMMYELRNKKFLIARKSMPSLRITAMALILRLLNEYDLPYDLHDSPPVMLYTGHGNETLFRGLDDPEKIKSYEPDFTWLEEASQFTNRDFGELNRRIRGISDVTKQLYLTFNPIDKLNSWIYKQFWERKRDNAAILTTTWRDNYTHLDQEYIDELELLEEQDKSYYDIYNLGEWGILANIVYTDWGMVPAFPPPRGDVFYGLDFGFTNPTALVEVRFLDSPVHKERIYEKELLYDTHLTNNDLIEKLKTLVYDKKDPIYADSGEPARIEEIRRAGFNIFPAQKDRKFGIDFVKRFHTNIVEPSVNLKKEKEAYHRPIDENTGEVKEEPVKFNDHLMDAERYGFNHLWRLFRRKVGRKVPTKDELGVP